MLDDLITPPVTTSNPIVTLFLYDIGEDATARNRPKSEPAVTVEQFRRAPQTPALDGLPPSPAKDER